MDQNSYKELQKTLIQVCFRIVKRGEGALFVVGDVPFALLIEQSVPSFKAVDNPKLLESLALIDGAVIIDFRGYVKSYGVMINSHKTFKNHGTRHSAAFSAARGNNLVFLVSEEDQKVRIFHKEKKIMELNGRGKHPLGTKQVRDVVNVLEAFGAGTVGVIGTSLVAPSFGVALIPGVIIFGSAYYLLRNLSNRIMN